MNKLPYLKRKLKIVGDIPAGYDGPIYYRILENNSGPPLVDKFEYDPLSKDRAMILEDPRNRLRAVLDSGLVVDRNGDLLPEWREPLRMNVLQDSPLGFEFIPGGLVSSRVYEIIQALDPGRHIFIPIDAYWPDGRVERMYTMKWGSDFFYSSVEMPVLDQKSNDLVTGTYTNGEIFYEKPDWIMGREAILNPYHFGFLNRNFVGNLNLFAASVLDNAVVISENLMCELRKLGNVFHGSDWFVRMGAV